MSHKIPTGNAVLDAAILATAEAMVIARIRDFSEWCVTLRGTLPTQWADYPTVQQQAVIGAYQTEIRDLSRPPSWDAALRLLAPMVDLPITLNAPHFDRFRCGEHCCNGDTGEMVKCDRHIYSLMVDGLDPVTFAACGIEADDRILIEGVDLLEPRPALVAALLAVAGREG